MCLDSNHHLILICVSTELFLHKLLLCVRTEAEKGIVVMNHSLTVLFAYKSLQNLFMYSVSQTINLFSGNIQWLI